MATKLSAALEKYSREPWFEKNADNEDGQYAVAFEELLARISQAAMEDGLDPKLVMYFFASVAKQTLEWANNKEQSHEQMLENVDSVFAALRAVGLERP